MRKNILYQVTSIENLEENGEVFDQLVEHIKKGCANSAVNEMLSWGAESDREPTSYNNILDAASSLNERIVYDDCTFLLTFGEDIITLYRFISVTDMLGDELNKGDEVLWADPDDHTRDLNRTWTIDGFQSKEIVLISTNEGRCRKAEVPPTELVKKSSIIHVEVID